jgi:hypothetical protein
MSQQPPEGFDPQSPKGWGDYRDDSRPEALLIRRSRRTGRFVKLKPTDRQMWIPFIGPRI